ncbi:MAG: hypothetical protein ACT4P6_18040 [Gemmatimonadaceae bacterium]
MDDILAITLQLAAVCEQLGLQYLVGGSLASSLHGIPRATQDVDFVVTMRQDDVAAFVAALREDFYLDEGAIRAAIERNTSFNVVHLGSYFKADVFVAKDDEPARLQLSRARRYEVADRSLVVASPEDVVAQKLFWYALGDRVSERQWADALGVLKVAGPSLDLQYLRRVASLLKVESLLREALEQIGLEP